MTEEYENTLSKEIHGYWRNPGEENHPSTYGRLLIGRSLFLVDKMRQHATPDDRILELGCSVGRNLAFLYHGGFKKLHGVDISEEAVRLMTEIFPELKQAQIDVSTIEDLLRKIGDDAFDVVFSMAVLEHLHTDSEWVFKEMTRISPKLIVIEDEFTESERHFPRSYHDIFTALGYFETDYQERVPGLPSTFRFRMFQRPAAETRAGVARS
jgi:2-polyprenyl-3-methyl-5-hydroxy-6-metoxy-1,4-benzoquinol methylase